MEVEINKYIQLNMLILTDIVVVCNRYMPHFLIHSPLGEHLGCLSILAIVNEAEMNMVGTDNSLSWIFRSLQIYTQEWDC